MSRIGLAIDPETNDLFLREDSSLAIVTDAEAVGQHVRQRVKTFEGEWFLDTSCGLPWLDQLFGKKYDPALAEALVKAEMLDTDGVTEITSFSVSFKQSLRNLVIKDVRVLTVYDQEADV